MLLAAGAANAGEPPPWPDGPDATGDWGGARSWLDDHGLHIDLDYTAETFLRLKGGEGTRAVYRGTVDLMLTVDTGNLGLWSGGTLFVYGQNGHGEGISPAIGADMLVSNLEAPPFTQLAEFWYEQRLFDDRLLLRLGKQDANQDFAAPRFPGNFVHSSYGAIPTVPMPTFPAPGLGAVVFVDPVKWLSLRGGVYEGAPEIESFGFDTAFEGRGLFVVAEALFRQALGADRPEAIDYSVGAWHHTGDIETARRTFPGNYGAFAVVDALVRLFPAIPGDERSVHTFVRVGWAPSDRSRPAFYAGGGATYHGIRGRDTLGIGVGHSHFPAGEGTDKHSETFLELFYKLRLFRWFTVEPDLQILFGPGGGDEVAVLGGLRVKLKL